MPFDHPHKHVLKGHKITLPRPSFIVLLGLLLLILILAPLVQQMSRPSVSSALGGFGLLVPLMAVATVERTVRQRRIALGLAALCILTSIDGLARLTGLPPQMGMVMSLIFLAYTTAQLLAGVVRSSHVTGDVLAGALAGYIMVGLTWAFAYGLLETLRPGSIRGMEAGAAGLDFSTILYFSYITQLTIGYGDLAPVSPVARIFSVLEGLMGMTFTTVILATLVAAYLSERRDGGAR